jgi:hypothetical protein
MKRIAFLVCSGIGYLIGHYFGDGAFAAYSSILISYHLYLAFLVVSAEKETGLSLPVGQTIVTHAACLAVVVGLAIGRHSIPFFGIIRLFIPAIAPFEVTWLFSGSKKNQKRVAAQIAAVLLPVPGAPLLIETVAAAPIAAAGPAIVPAEPVCAATVTIDTVPAAAAPIALVAPTPVPAEPVRTAVTVDNVPVATYSFVTPARTAPPSRTPAPEVEDDYEEFIKHMQSGKRPFRKPGMTVKQEFELWLAHRTKSVQAVAAGPAQTTLQA